MMVLFSAAVVLVSLIGGATPLLTVLTHVRLQLYLSASAGVMLGAAFFHMMPEAVELDSPDVLRWAAVGLLALFFVERFFAYHHHEAPRDLDDPCPEHPHEHASRQGHSAGLISDHALPGPGPTNKGISLQWGAAAFGLTIHSLVGGVALASAVQADGLSAGGVGAASWSVFIATVCHKPADALTIVSLMLRAGISRRAVHLVNLAFSLMVPAGAVLFEVGRTRLGADLSQQATAACLAFSAGTFLCISLSDLLPELQFHAHDRFKLSLALLSGVGLMAGAGYFG